MSWSCCDNFNKHQMKFKLVIWKVGGKFLTRTTRTSENIFIRRTTAITSPTTRIFLSRHFSELAAPLRSSCEPELGRCGAPQCLPATAQGDRFGVVSERHAVRGSSRRVGRYVGGVFTLLTVGRAVAGIAQREFAGCGGRFVREQTVPSRFRKGHRECRRWSL